MRLIINTDGASRGNPGPAALGVVIKKGDQIIEKYSQYLGKATNNQAEYQAVIFALKKIKLIYGKKKAKDTDLEFRVDSELMAKQLNHQYKIKQKELRPLFFTIWNLMLDFKEVDFVYVSREKNKEADRLANQALDQEQKIQKLL